MFLYFIASEKQRKKCEMLTSWSRKCDLPKQILKAADVSGVRSSSSSSSLLVDSMYRLEMSLLWPHFLHRPRFNPCTVYILICKVNCYNFSVLIMMIIIMMMTMTMLISIWINIVIPCTKKNRQSWSQAMCVKIFCMKNHIHLTAKKKCFWSIVLCFTMINFFKLEIIWQSLLRKQS